MFYTIATLEATGGEQVLDISRNGNQYVIGIYDRESHESATKAIKSLDDAEALFLKYARFFIESRYTCKARMEMLRNE